MKDIPGKITIGRPSCGSGEKYISIQIKDESSRIRFLEVKISLDQFAECITGRSEVPIMMTVSGLEHIGKVKESKPMSFPISSHDRDLAAKLAKELCPEGWLVSKYFGSQKSFSHDNAEGYTAHTTIYRYVESLSPDYPI